MISIHIPLEKGYPSVAGFFLQFFFLHFQNCETYSANFLAMLGHKFMTTNSLFHSSSCISLDGWSSCVFFCCLENCYVTVFIKSHTTPGDLDMCEYMKWVKIAGILLKVKWRECNVKRIFICQVILSNEPS